MPIVQFNDNNEETAIGVTTSVWYENGNIKIQGISRFGGTENEVLELDKNGHVNKMKIIGVGLSK